MLPETKRLLNIFWHATMRGCTIAIAILFLFFAIMSIITVSEGTSTQGMTFSSLLTLTLFALLISYAKEIFRAKSIPTPAQWLINFLIIGIGFFFVILRSGSIASTSGSFYVTGVIMYILVYLVVFGVTMLVKHLCARKQAEGEKEVYISRFEEV